jgi:hypothetical protein
MRKQLCACGCGNKVSQKVESRHMSALAPALLVSQVLDQNKRLIRRKKRSRVIGSPAPFRQQLAMGNTTRIDDMDMDHDDDEDFYMDHPGPSALSDDDGLDPLSHNSPIMMGEDPTNADADMDERASSPPNDDAGMGENFDDEVYGLSDLRRSQRIAGRVENIGQQRWGSNAPANFVNNREESDEEEEDIGDDESISDFDVASDEGLEGYDDDDDDDNEMFAGPGQEGISLWDSLGEGFLREASQLGTSMLFFYYYYFKF